MATDAKDLGTGIFGVTILQIPPLLFVTAEPCFPLLLSEQIMKLLEAPTFWDGREDGIRSHALKASRDMDLLFSIWYRRTQSAKGHQADRREVLASCSLEPPSV